MRNTFALIIALLAVLASSCSQDELLEKRRLSYIDDTEFFASFDTDSILSRTYIEEDAETSKLYLRWTKADEITIFRGNTLNQRYQYKGETGDNSAGFRQIASDDFVSYNDLDNPTNYAVYPYNENTRITEKGVLNIALPANQKYAEKSFGLGANTMVAVTQHTGDVNLLFKNVCGYFKFKFYGEDLTIRSVTLQGNNEENLAGNANVTSGYGSLPAMTMVSDTTKTLTLDCGEAGIKVGATKETATEFWFVVPPTQFTKGFTITVTDTDGGKFTKTTEKVFEIKRNTVKPISAIEVETVPDNIILYTADTPITPYNMNAFGATYMEENSSYDSETKKGLLYFDGAISMVGDSAFYYDGNLNSISLPNGIKKIGNNAFAGCVNMTDINIPKSVTIIGESSFSICESLISEITIPKGVVTIEKDAFSSCEKLVNVNLAEGIADIKDGAFYRCSNLKQIVFPSTLNKIGKASFLGTGINSVTIPNNVISIAEDAFSSCENLVEFKGKYSSEDNLSLIVDDVLIAFAIGSDVNEYKIPNGITRIGQGVFRNSKLSKVVISEGVTSIGHFAFQYCPNLTSLTFPESVVLFSNTSICSCENLSAIYGKYASRDNRCWVINGVLGLFAPGGLTSYTIPEGVTSIVGGFYDCDNLKSVVVSEGVSSIGDLVFDNCDQLTEIVLPESITSIGTAVFQDCINLKQVYCKAVKVPSGNSYMFRRNHSDLIVYVPKEVELNYKNATYWCDYANFIQGYDYTNSGYYPSTDYFQDGKVTTLQTATKGNGIDIVLMGDGYSDRQIADGTYDNTMNTAMEKFFSEEPYKNYRDHFNVYSVKAVSATEGYEYNNTAFSGYFGSGTRVGGDDKRVFAYAQKAIDEERMDEALIVVMMNSTRYAGTCYMYHPSVTEGYGNGVSVSYFPVGEDENALAQVLHHEAGGHGFAKLADEYAYESLGAIPATEVTTTKEEQTNWGWWKNVDFTSDPSATRWSHFINDTRYANDGLGAYEGGLTYWTGVWRPTENSIMRHNTGGFNAPSREAIYYRIHKLAYGDSWQYDYEEFVKYDAINRKAAASSYNPYRQTNYKPLHAPVVIRKSWKDVK